MFFCPLPHLSTSPPELWMALNTASPELRGHRARQPSERTPECLVSLCPFHRCNGSQKPREEGGLAEGLQPVVGRARRAAGPSQPGRAGLGSVRNLHRKADLVVPGRGPSSISVVLPLGLSLPVGSVSTSQSSALFSQMRCEGHKRLGLESFPGAGKK